jgi:pyridoxal phosphate enzyme (YggS family)
VTGEALTALISRNLAAVRSRMERAATGARRDPTSIRLIAVSKTFGEDHVRAAAASGQRDFGENRVQEALPKIDATADLAVRWHLIGHLQSNKARKSVGPFIAVHSVDSVELLRRLDSVATELRRGLDVLIQLDLAGEATKHGLDTGRLEDVMAAGRECRSIRVTGLMLLPPLFEDPEATRPYFRRVRELRDRLQAGQTPASQLRELSMGMSHDFEVAIEEGATMIRVGTAIFGARS